MLKMHRLLIINFVVYDNSGQITAIFWNFNVAMLYLRLFFKASLQCVAFQAIITSGQKIGFDQDFH